eukprot:TRINITY_DN4681_c0_g1_i1.p1 TRINITY_DN4681_c0_g1~~TRINITY_DN4681_c0_g1_i1.p1  ORF type:complete len:429 (+),score=62.54 TRINITY_DN4681_c0_g1_i1:106-1392(+)
MGKISDLLLQSVNTDGTVNIDPNTQVPAELFVSMLKHANQAKLRGQHRLVFEAKEKSDKDDSETHQGKKKDKRKKWLTLTERSLDKADKVEPPIAPVSPAALTVKAAAPLEQTRPVTPTQPKLQATGPTPLTPTKPPGEPARPSTANRFRGRYGRMQAKPTESSPALSVSPHIGHSSILGDKRRVSSDSVPPLEANFGGKRQISDSGMSDASTHIESPNAWVKTVSVSSSSEAAWPSRQVSEGIVSLSEMSTNASTPNTAASRDVVEMLERHLPPGAAGSRPTPARPLSGGPGTSPQRPRSVNTHRPLDNSAELNKLRSSSKNTTGGVRRPQSTAAAASRRPEGMVVRPPPTARGSSVGARGGVGKRPIPPGWKAMPEPASMQVTPAPLPGTAQGGSGPSAGAGFRGATALRNRSSVQSAGLPMSARR